MSGDLEYELFAELDREKDWLPVASTLGIFGTNARHATPDQFRRLLACIDASPHLCLGVVDSTFRTIAEPLPVERITAWVFDLDGPLQRLAVFMRLFIDRVGPPDDTADPTIPAVPVEEVLRRLGSEPPRPPLG